jgi:cytochrome b561
MTSRLLAIAASGWLLVALLSVTIALPYRLRRRRPRPWRSPAPPAPLMPAVLPAPPRRAQQGRLRFHYWLGYAIAALALVHGMASMTRGIAGRAHPAGLKLASVALLVAFWQVGLGLWLRGKSGRRAAGRRLHFWVMAALVALVVLHVALDSWLLGTFHGS